MLLLCYVKVVRKCCYVIGVMASGLRRVTDQPSRPTYGDMKMLPWKPKMCVLNREEKIYFIKQPPTQQRLLARECREIELRIEAMCHAAKEWNKANN